VDANLQLNLQGLSSLDHRVRAAGDLSSALSWNVVSTRLSGADASWLFTDSYSDSYPGRFYRATSP
jgi:hypothetical protein